MKDLLAIVACCIALAVHTRLNRIEKKETK